MNSGLDSGGQLNSTGRTNIKDGELGGLSPLNVDESMERVGGGGHHPRRQAGDKKRELGHIPGDHVAVSQGRRIEQGRREWGRRQPSFIVTTEEEVKGIFP
ncbi:hypothetical protein MLD38_013114 [Melastoma candidum]|uniref:Uncharacterized protein n=1 Tax=Melastoma candidum TaxID=119954 RepID=A0ACB9RGY8_9MYRT|nr:hypothetical protein MLD38_013114 [Melastoma candidum]